MPDLVFALAGNLYRNSRALRQIRTLADADFRVRVLAFPGDPTGVSLPKNVDVTTVPINHTRGPAFFREIRLAFQRAAIRLDADHLHASDLYVLSAVATAATRAGVTYSYDARECYPHVSSTVGRPWVSWYWRRIENRYIQGTSMTFTVSESIARHMATEYRIADPIVVLNVQPTRTIAASDHIRRSLNLAADAPIVLHLGQVRKDRGCDILVRAMTHVDDAHLVFMGGGPEPATLGELVAESPARDRIHFLPPVPPDRVLDAAAAATVGVTLLQDTCLNHRYALPNKLFEYISSGLPVLSSDLIELHRVVNEWDIGRTVDGSDPLAVGTAISSMIQDPEKLAAWRRSAAVARETFDWEVASQPFIAPFRELIL